MRGCCSPNRPNSTTCKVFERIKLSLIYSLSTNFAKIILSKMFHSNQQRSLSIFSLSSGSTQTQGETPYQCQPNKPKPKHIQIVLRLRFMSKIENKLFASLLFLFPLPSSCTFLMNMLFISTNLPLEEQQFHYWCIKE